MTIMERIPKHLTLQIQTVYPLVRILYHETAYKVAYKVEKLI